MNINSVSTAVSLALLAGSAQAQSIRYQAHENGLQIGDGDHVSGFNDAHQAYGWKYFPPGYTQSTGFTYASGVFSFITAPAGTVNCRVWGMNHAGAAVGSTDVGGESAFVSDATSARLLPGLPSAIGTDVHGINDAGVIVGSVRSAAAGTRAAVWVNESLQLLPGLTPTPHWDFAFAINNTGMIVGQVTTPANNGQFRPALWRNGVLTDLGTFGGCCGTANTVNDAGQIVGRASDATGRDHAFLWQNGVMTQIVPGNLDLDSNAVAISDDGTVIGYMEVATDDYREFWYRDGVLMQLTDLILPTPGYEWNGAEVMSGNGSILGSFIYPPYGGQTMLELIPIPWNEHCSADYNNDGDVGTDADIETFFACLGGNCCTTCASADFNGDGDVGTDADIEAFFRVLAGGAC